ncbi:helix-turn-helix domain-containing protein [Chitinimonas sp. BJB300]|uniref:helix-turn-helix domain-containing protein n=1 Tax=Chitinimonas sp. BJB300 TaxID=1559339 RepID=UPI000C0F6264|nr:helix-turn-helix transcriptional regulator [Chitinimonas sp. BJB300]PHV12043.1 hypothetical protein CSQ89_07840 [Chitinimonas sp. BJB300]TSJ84919.1 helix-turn-helix transcriptional regulator [Chitinimonas sp. BJB300]
MELPTLAERLIDALKKKNMGQSQLARMVGLTPQAVNGLTTGKNKSIDGENLLKVAAALGVNPLWLIANRGPRIPTDPPLLADVIPGYTLVSMPDELLRLFEAYFEVHANRPIPSGFIDGAVLLVKSLYPTEETAPATATTKERGRK